MKIGDVVQTYIKTPPDPNSLEPWDRWRRDAIAASEVFASDAMQFKNVKMVVEIELLLRCYEENRIETTVMKQIHSTETPLELYRLFSKKIAIDEKWQNGGTFDQEEKYCMMQTEQMLIDQHTIFMSSKERREVSVANDLVARGKIMHLAVETGFVNAVMVVLGMVKEEEEKEEEVVRGAWSRPGGAGNVAGEETKQNKKKIKHEDPDDSENEDNIDPHLLLMMSMKDDQSDSNEMEVLQKVNINQVNDKHETALFVACKQGHYAIVQLLLGLQEDDTFEMEVDMNACDSKGYSPLLIAVEQNHIDVVELLLNVTKKVAVDPETEKEGGREGGRFKNVTAVNINQGKENGETPLYVACHSGFFDVVQLLLSTKGILINQSKDNQATPLFAACEQGYQDVVRLLLQTRGISSNLPKDNGSTPLFVACLHSNLDEIKALLSSKKTNPNCILKDGVTPLHRACDMGNAEVVAILLRAKKIDVNQWTVKGSTPIAIASMRGHEDVVRLMLRCEKVNVLKKDDRGRSSLDMARKEKYFDILHKLDNYRKFGRQCLR